MISLENKSIIVDEETYEIIENVSYENRLFIYLVNQNDELDSFFKELIIKDDSYTCEDIDSTLFNTKILDLFVSKFNEY